MKGVHSVLVIILLCSSIQGIVQSSDIVNNSQDERNTHGGLFRVSPALSSVDISRAAEIVGGNPGVYHDIIISQKDREYLESKGYDLISLDEDPFASAYQVAYQYHTFDEMVSLLEGLHQEFPQITDLFSLGKSYENRDIWCLEISDNPGIDEDEPEVLFMGLHHAREWPTLEICLELCDTLTRSYGTNTTIHDLVDNRKIWIIPCVNPDGYVYDHDVHLGSQWWRKNRHYIESYDLYGIDLNRNYGGATNGDIQGMWGSLGMSHHPSSELYCGNNPFSELETQAIKRFVIDHNICGCISWHTYSELVMWPWGYSEDVQTPHDEYMGTVGTEIASRITKQFESGTYTPTQAAGLYPTSGDTIDWIYGYSHYVKGKPCFGYTIEACASFHPEEEFLEQVCTENIQGALYLLEESSSIDLLQPMVIPPIIDDIEIVDDTRALISWQVLNPKSSPEYFELREFQSINLLVDDGESPSDLVSLDGFSRSEDKAYTGSYCFAAHQDSNRVSSLTTVHPLYVNESMDLRFHCWYDIESDWDMAVVEISTDGRSYDIIDKFTGSSNGWILREYTLDRYMGQSIFIRFRYSTDAATLGEGFFIDDLYPVASYDQITTIDSMIAEQEYLVTIAEEHDVLYQVRGYNDLFGFGDYSMLQPVQQSTVENLPPDRPMITGPTQGTVGTDYDYEIKGSDPDGDHLFYYVMWGDESIDEWVGPYASGESITLSHRWDQKGNYLIELRAMDNQNAKSEWETLPISLQKSKSIDSVWDMIISLFPFLSDLYDFFIIG